MYPIFYLDYYEGYLLDVDYYSLQPEDLRLLDCCIWLVDNNASIRECSKNFMISKSSLHRHIHNKLRKLSSELFQCTMRVLKKHKEV